MDERSINLLHLINGLLTFSYAVLYSTLALFLADYLGYSKATANIFVGIFLTYNFALHLIAGFLGDHYFSNRSLLLVSACFQFLGTLILSFYPTQFLLFGLSLIIFGCGINTTSLKCILLQLVDSDIKREKVFFINYTVMNTAFLAGFFTAGWFDKGHSYTTLFGICNFFNLLAIISIVIGWKSYQEKIKILKEQNYLRLLITFVVLLVSVYIGFKYTQVVNYFIALLCISSITYLFFQMKSAKVLQEKKNIFVFMILSLASLVFWALYFIGPMGLTFFLKNNVAQVWGFVIPPQWFMNLNSIFVIIGTPLLASIFEKFRVKGYKISFIKLFSVAIILMALSYLVLSIGIVNANNLGYVSSIWVTLHFLLQAIGEIFVAPVGYAMVGQLAPQRLQGLMMGMWMMIAGVSSYLAQYLSNLDYSDSIVPLVTNASYLSVFNNLVCYSLFLSGILIIFSKKIEQMITKKCSIND